MWLYTHTSGVKILAFLDRVALLFPGNFCITTVGCVPEGGQAACGKLPDVFGQNDTLHASTLLPEFNLACDALSSWLPGSKHVGETAWKIYTAFSHSQKLASVQIFEAEWTQKSIAFLPMKKLSMFFFLIVPLLACSISPQLLRLFPLSPWFRCCLFNTLLHLESVGFTKNLQSTEFTWALHSAFPVVSSLPGSSTFLTISGHYVL